MESNIALPNSYGYKYYFSKQASPNVYELVMPRDGGEVSYVRFLPKETDQYLNLQDIGTITIPGGPSVVSGSSTINGNTIISIWEFKERIYLEVANG